jgi:putative oxidoreductase
MTSATLTSTSVPSRAKTRTLWAIRILLALAFGAAGAAKLAGVPMMVATFEAIGWGQWFRYVTGGIELTGAVLLLVPVPGMALLAGLLLGGTMVGATISHLLVVPGSPVPALVLGALCAVVVVSQRRAA